MKTCPQCKQEKLLDDFGFNSYSKSGVQSWCKECSRLKCLAHYYKNPEKILNSARKRKYGLTNNEYKTMQKSQKGVCMICKKPEKLKQQGTLKSLSVDHDHKTRKIRGLLCIRCNSGLGHFDEDPKLLRHAATYIEKGRKK
jgi:predicted transcriptional regulator YheO